MRSRTAAIVMMAVLSFTAAPDQVAASGNSTGASAPQDVLQTFILDILPSPAVVKDPEAAVRQRIPGLAALTTTMSYGPSLGNLTVASRPENAVRIAELVRAYQTRPHLEYDFRFDGPGSSSAEGATENAEGSEGMAGTSAIRTVDDRSWNGYSFQARGKAQPNGSVLSEVSAAVYVDGRENSFTGALPLKPGKAMKILLAGSDHVSLTVTVRPYSL